MTILRLARAVALAASATLVASCGKGGATWSPATAVGTPPTISVGGTVSGLNGTAVLENNGGDRLSVSTSGPFAFPTPIPVGTQYNVTIVAQPLGQTCSVANGSGTAIGASVSNVGVA